MSRSYPIRLSLALATLLILLGIGLVSAASSGRIATPAAAPEDQICDPTADYYLGMEDYPKAVELHEALIRRHPGKAFAYYHLGFAYGILGNHDRELVDLLALQDVRDGLTIQNFPAGQDAATQVGPPGWAGWQGSGRN